MAAMQRMKSLTPNLNVKIQTPVLFGRRNRAGVARKLQDLTVRVSEQQSGGSGLITENDEHKIDVLIQRFKKADMDGSGCIDRHELRQLLNSTDGGDAVVLSEYWLPEAELEAVMEKYDKNKNGTIDFEEFKQIVYDGLLLDGQLSEYEAAFRAVDYTGNGTIGANELAKVFAELGEPMKYEKMVEIMRKYDKDESGQIEFNEFLQMFRGQLLELKDIETYVSKLPKGRNVTPTVLEAAVGDMSLMFSEQELDEVLQSAPEDKAVVVFSALTWCRPSKAMQKPALQLAEAYKDSSVWVKVFGNANEQTKQLFKNRLRVRSTPCFIIFKGGKVAFTQTKASRENLEAGLRSVLADHPSFPRQPVFLRP